MMFICNHCPFVKHVFTGIVDLANDYQDKGVAFVAISSNDVENYPDDAPDLMTKVAAEQNFPFLISMMKVKMLHEHMMLLVHLIFTSLTAIKHWFIVGSWMILALKMESQSLEKTCDRHYTQ